MPLIGAGVQCIIIPLQPSPGGEQVGLDFRIRRIVHLACKHLLFLTACHCFFSDRVP